MSTTPAQEPSAAPSHDSSLGGQRPGNQPGAASAADAQPTVPLSHAAAPVQPQTVQPQTGQPQQTAQQQAVPFASSPQQGIMPPPGAMSQSEAAPHPQSQLGQPTVDANYAGQYENAPQAPQAAASAQPKGRTGVLLAGLALGALLGGVVGGGVSAIVASNVSQPSATVQGGGSGTLTLNNTETATAISGVAAVATPSVVTLSVSTANSSGSGSGVIYREDGYIITNAHVVTLDGAAGSDAKVRVQLSDGRILDGSVVGVDPYADLAVVKVDAESLPAVEVADSDALNVGDLTVAIGAPLNLANTVTSGVVSSVNRGISVGSALIPDDSQSEEPEQEDDGGGGFPWDFRFDTPDQGEQQQQQQTNTTGGTVTLPVIQTDASINPGNSGGALLNGKGELIGINVAIASATSSSGTAGSDGLGFAIPSNLATRVADALIAGEQPSHGLLGASVGDSYMDTDEDANHAGGLIMEVVQGGAAEAAGLRVGDVITAIEGIPAADGTSVSALIRKHAGGSEVVISYTRAGVAGETTATLGQLQ